jgi:CHASE2 domain-containing sensor protein
LRQLGPWPWSRIRLADLSNKLAEQGTALQIFDIVFPEATDNDGIFLASLEKNNAILSQVFALQASGCGTLPHHYLGLRAQLFFLLQKTS